MAYVIFTANGEEYDRRELRGPVVLGRAPDCDVAIPDITLSRHHCRIEPSENGRGWQIVDLHSKNGTHFLGHAVETHVFRDTDELRIGRTRLTFCAGEFVRTTKVKSRGVIRPSDPHEALAGTVTGMVLCEPDEVERHEGMPVPQPRPSDPMSFQKDDIYGMINEIASSSWDSIQAQASQPIRMQRATPTPAMTQANRGAIRPKPRVSFALQADHGEDSAGAPQYHEQHLSATKRENAILAAASGGGRARRLMRKFQLQRPRRSTLIAVAASVLVVVFLVGWITVLMRAMRDDVADPAPARRETPALAPGGEAARPAAFIQDVHDDIVCIDEVVHAALGE
jgi:pSer/pThr/pTyr-binding forkhead associated (FHA) protein